MRPASTFFNIQLSNSRVSLTRQVLFLIPLVLIFPRFMGIDGVMYAGPIADMAAAVVAIAFAVKEHRKMTELTNSFVGK